MPRKKTPPTSGFQADSMAQDPSGDGAPEGSVGGRPVRKARLVKVEDDDYVNPDVELEGPPQEDSPVSERLTTVIENCMDLGYLPEMVVAPEQEASSSKRAASARKSLEERGVKATSRLRGVTHHMRTGKWEGHIWDQGKQLYLGGFNTEFQAGLSHDLAIIKLRGPKSHTNFQLIGPELDAYKELLPYVTALDVLNALRHYSRARRPPPQRRMPAPRIKPDPTRMKILVPPRKMAGGLRATPEHLIIPGFPQYSEESGYDNPDFGSATTTYYRNMFSGGFEDEDDGGYGVPTGNGRYPIPDALAVPSARKSRKISTSSSPGTAAPAASTNPLYNYYRSKQAKQAQQQQQRFQWQPQQTPEYDATDTAEEQDMTAGLATNMYAPYPSMPALPGVPGVPGMSYMPMTLPIEPMLPQWPPIAYNWHQQLLNPAAGCTTDEEAGESDDDDDSNSSDESSDGDESMLGFKPRVTRLYPPFWIPSAYSAQK